MPRRKLRAMQIVRDPQAEENTESPADLSRSSGVGSSQVPEIVEEPVNIEGESGRRRKTRGATVMSELYNLPAGERVKVNCNSMGIPIGAEAGVLANFIGVTARNSNMLPITYASWHEMPNANKNQPVEYVKERFSVECSDDFIKKSLGKKWRDNKSTLKSKYFKIDGTLQDKIDNVPPGILRFQWEDACTFWNSAKGEARQHVGVTSRQHQKFTHTAGSKSFARIANEEEITTGSSVGRIRLFDLTHTKKDGTPVNTEAEEIMAKLKEKRTEFQTAASTDSSINVDEIEHQVMAEVLGPERYGRVRCQGSFITLKKFFGATSSHYTPSQSQSEKEKITRLENEVTELKAQLEANNVARDERVAELTAQLEANNVARDEKVAELASSYQSLKDKFEEMMGIFQQHRPSNPSS